MRLIWGAARGAGSWLGALALAGALAGCAPEIGGRASFPILSKGALPGGYETVARVDEKRCTHVVLFIFGWGNDANHEALVTDILQEHKGDAIANADLTFHAIPAVFYNRQCARVRGDVIRRTAAAGLPPAPAPAAPEAPGKEKSL